MDEPLQDLFEAERRARLEAEEALRRCEERYRDLVETANDVVLAIDLQGNFTALNTAGQQVSGYTRDEILHMNIADLLSEESYRRAQQMIQQKLRDGRGTTYDLEMIARDGRRIPLEVSSKLIYHGDRVVGVQAIARDITDRLRAEEELRARERKQATVADIGQQALATADLSVLFGDSIRCVAQTLDVEFGTVLELVDDGTRLLARAGVGWRPGVVEHEWVGAGPESQAGYTLLASGPVLVEDLRQETRFSVPTVLRDHEVVSGISVIIHGHARPFGVLSAFTANHRRFAQDDVHFMQAVANVLATAVERKRLEEERAQHDKDLAARVLQAQEEERKRIARELHDETAQTLSILLTNLDLLERHLPLEDPTVASGFERVEALAKRALDETRALSHDLRPTILDDAGLVAALEWIAVEYERSYGGKAEVHADIDPAASISPEVEVALFRIAQEALTNAGKHAAATRVRVTLSISISQAELVVKDNGCGFRPEQLQGPTRESGLGLYGIAERAALFDGTLSIRSRPAKGTVVRVRMPITEPAIAGQALRLV